MVRILSTMRVYQEWGSAWAELVKEASQRCGSEAALKICVDLRDGNRPTRDLYKGFTEILRFMKLAKMFKPKLRPTAIKRRSITLEKKKRT